MKIDYICPHCGDNDLRRVTYADWHPDTQSWDDYKQFYQCYHCGLPTQEPEAVEVSDD